MQPFFTGKPRVDGLGHVFLMRNYRSELGKWLTADPMGYPDGWNQLAYCGNNVLISFDFCGCSYDPSGLSNEELTELFAALGKYLGAAESWIGDIGSAVVNQFWSKELFSRYYFGYGNCNLDIKAISDTAVVKAIEQHAVSSLYAGSSNISPYYGTFSGDFYSALGQIRACYSVEDCYGYWRVYVSIEDLYDFHKTGNNVQLLGFDKFWNGGSMIYDKWLFQLQDMKLVHPFWVFIDWNFTVDKKKE